MKSSDSLCCYGSHARHSSGARSIAFPVLELPMKVLTLLPRCDLKRHVENTLSSAQFRVDNVTSAKDSFQFSRFARYAAGLIDSDALVLSQTLVLVKQL